MLRFPPVTGSIKPVSLSSYSEIVGEYADRVRMHRGVLGIVQIGEVTQPGVSDIDLVVVLDDTGPWPSWGDLSLQRACARHPDRHVVAHDVFVWPLSVARKAEAFFFLDHQHVLAGEKLGGEIDAEEVRKYRRFLTLEYTLHRLELLFHLLLQRTIDLRVLVLFLSTLRHSARLANELGAGNSDENWQLVADVNSLRESVVAGCMVEDNGWAILALGILENIARTLARQLATSIEGSVPGNWRTGLRTGIVDSDDGTGLRSVWESFVERQRGRWLSRHVKIVPVPRSVHLHVACYLTCRGSGAAFLKRSFGEIGYAQDRCDEHTRLRSQRADLVVKQWELVRNGGFYGSSGKGYPGLSMPSPPSLRSVAQSVVYRAETARLRARCRHALDRDSPESV